MARPDPRPASTAAIEARVHLHDLKPQLVDMREEVLAGLGATPRRIAPKYFYDQRGSELFEAITRLPEYYPTRAEISIFESRLDALCAILGRGNVLLEFGSGSSRKIRLLLEGLRPTAYLPVDISREHLLEAARALAADYEWLEVHAICADYAAGFELPWRPRSADGESAPITGFFPGSSIGNFERAAAGRFLAGVHRTLGAGGQLLIGVDRRKDKARLEAAYNDAAGVTAAFNRNALLHLNRALDGDIDVEAFDHRAHYNEEAGRIEMHLVARRDLTFSLAAENFAFAAGETIHTENSYKYAPDEFRALAAGAGFDTVEEFTDTEGLFSVFILRAV
ncbi:MAG: L-histidine N(alpha)-methyltransferase [Gammaproteobacteria bacterium]|nr:L-histidine N(alpha)-methyltransferase [Gammaproteobacteria bacterium]